MKLTTIPLTENARYILNERYLIKDSDGTLESPEEMFWRVAQSIAQGEKEEDRQLWSTTFYELMASLKFLPNSPTLINVGTGKGCLSACFCISPEDSMDSIMQIAYDAAMVEKWGGGIGFGLSKLRPKGDSIATVHGQACGPVAVMKLYSSVGRTLTQGSFRLGAHMGQLICSHPDIREFIHCKDGDDTLQNFNISVQITDAFMRAVEDGSEWALINPRTNQVVGSVPAKELWQEINESAWKTGDPGVVFIDRVWETAPNPQMGRIETSNPCLAKGTLIATPDGWTPVEDIPPGCYILASDGIPRMVQSIEVHRDMPVYLVEFGDGSHLRATHSHQFQMVDGTFKSLDKLSVGDKVKISPTVFTNNPSTDKPEGWTEREWGFLTGVLLGDGGLTAAGGRSSIAMDSSETEWVEILKNLVRRLNKRPTILDQSKTYDRSAKVWIGRHSPIPTLERVISPFKSIPLIYQNANREFLTGLLDGLFSTDGTVNGRGNGQQLRLSTSSGILAQDVRRVLLGFGIHARMYLRKPSVGRINDREIHARYERYQIMVYGEGLRVFADCIGLTRPRKAQALTFLVGSMKYKIEESWVTQITSITPDGSSDVYDLHEPITDTWIAEGIVNRGCGEEFLENYGNCCLGSINLDKHVSGEAFDWDALERTVRTAMRFLDDVIEVNHFPLPKLREVNLATRRVGLGVMGWADALVRLNLPYDSEEALELTDRLGGFIKRVAWDESAKLAEERGPFPEYERSALKEGGMPPVRNSSVVTIAPTGTISRIAGCSSGIEPHFAIAWWSNVLWKDHKGTSSRLLDAPTSVWETLRADLWVEDKVVSEILEQIAGHPKDVERILSEQGLNSSSFRTSMTINPEAHVKMQAVWQKHVTNSVSKTINLPNSATVQDVEDSFLLAWKLGCKAVTVYRDGAKSMQVLETGQEEVGEVEKVSEDVLVIPILPTPLLLTSHSISPRSRPRVMKGETERVRTGHGNLYVSVNFNGDGKPFEVFSTLGKAGGCNAANLEAISRLISLALRSGVKVEYVVEQLKEITCCPLWDEGVLVRSTADAVAMVLAKSAGIKGEVKTLEGTEGRNENYPSRCQICNGRIAYREGCEICLDCARTKCD